MEFNGQMMEEFTAVSFIDTKFPITTKSAKCKFDESEEKKLGFDPNAINSKLTELVNLVHGSLESKSKIVDEFN